MEKTSLKKELLNCILLIDDDPIALLISSTILTDMQVASKVISVSDAFEAIEFLKTCSPALILVDIQMPGMNGIEFISEINRHPDKDKIKIVALSSHLRRLDKDKLMSSDILDFIDKPITEEKIFKILEHNSYSSHK